MRMTALIKKILPDHTEEALHAMISCTQNAINAFEEETNALALGQSISLAEQSREKKAAHKSYQAAACEFMARKDEFLEYGGQLVDKLKTLQIELKKQAQVNMQYWEPHIPSRHKSL